jgi:mono/diheme cytochrome c family protein
MTRPIVGLVFVTAALSLAQNLEQGAQLFRATCAQGYCHGSGGTQGRAPKLLGRNFDGPSAAKIIGDGVANTGMPGFRQRLSASQLDDVIAYVIKISGGDMSTLKASANAASSGMPESASKGKTLFFDPLRGVDRCGTCHALEGVGSAIGPNLASGGPHTAGAIRQGKPAAVRLAALRNGEKFPTLVVEQGDWFKLYDLGANPPVLRTLAKPDVTFTASSPWRHADATRRYNDDELAAIAEYLSWAAKQ